MNLEMLKRTRGHVAANENFNMLHFIRDEQRREVTYVENVPKCGTAGYIGGSAILFALATGFELAPELPMEKAARIVLGLPKDEARVLFYPKHKPYKEVTRDEALHALDAIIDGRAITETFWEDLERAW